MELGTGQPWMHTQTAEKAAGEQHHRKEPGVLVDGKLNISQ